MKSPLSVARPIALTMGEPAGVGGEITMLAWRDNRTTLPPYFVVDSLERLKKLARKTGIECPLEPIGKPADTMAVFDRALPVLPLQKPCNNVTGTPSIENNPAVIESIDRAVEFALSGEAAALVTNPVHKETLYAGGFSHPGHTEYLGELAGAETAPVMMLASDELRVVPVTIHLSLSDAIAELSAAKIVYCAETTHRDLQKNFGISDPRLAIAGLNPHAGEGGHLGLEEETIIRPALDTLAAKGISISGPLPPDTMFHTAARANYDAALCMYHDQALIPIKTLAFDRAVNVTLGLPIIRTSPDHGTAFDIAGTGKASPASLIAALIMADSMAKARFAP